ncbi:geranylgeranyl pyrophosphate synthase [Holotrichia oblita]|uniref:Geranylgeranyl pyrophosphate synthase n=1 Tax=Holotrichia oblita TaxID=644536 RepID=A0ACB9TE93_HOLOL|nr:geranylgeranyl pyrophosphate synthase [Holotrichia oblita]
MDEIIKRCKPLTKKLGIGHLQLQRVQITEGAFADDIVIFAKNERDLQTNLSIWNTAINDNGMRINKSKTKVMMIGENIERMNIEIDKEKIEQVDHFQYLGVIIDETGTNEADINSRIQKTNKLYYAMNTKFINKKEISKQTKLKVFNAIYRLVLTFGCESWTLSERQKCKVQAMKYLRRVRGVTKRDRMRNTDIRRDLGTKSIFEFIEERQLSWWGHLQRMNMERPVKKVWKAKIQKNRKKGRPRKTWDSVMGEILTNRGVLHSQRIVGEVTEMIRTSNSLHKGLITINDNNNDVLSMKIGNKVALLSGDYLLSSSYEQLARIRNHDLNELMSSAFKDLTENEFIGPRDRDNKPLPHKPEPENKELHIPNEFGITTSNFKHFLGHAKSEWILRSTLGGASLLGKACKGVLLLAGHHEDFQMNGYLLGKYLALCLEATRDYNSVFSDRNISPISAPVLFYLQRYPKFYSTFQQLINSENKFDDGDMRSKLQQSPALSDTILLQNELCEKTLSVLENFRNCDAKIALQNIVHSVKLHV